MNDEAKKVAEELRREAAGGQPATWGPKSYHDWLKSLANRLDPPPEKMRLWVMEGDGRICWGEQPDAIGRWREYVPASEVVSKEYYAKERERRCKK